MFLSDTDISLRDLAWRMWCRDSIQGSTIDSLLVLKWNLECCVVKLLLKSYR